MLERMRFNLSRGYLSKSTLAENTIGMDEEIVSRILSELSSLDGDKIECYYYTLRSAYTDPEMVNDYLIMYKMDDGYKPIIIKHGVHQWSRPYEWFESEWWKELEKTKNSYKLHELLDLVCEGSREKFHEFLKEKYSDVIKQDVLLF